MTERTIPLDTLMTAARISNAELAREVGVTDEAVAKWRSGEATPRPESQAAVCEVLTRRLAENKEAAIMHKASAFPERLWPEAAAIGRPKLT